MIVANAVPRPPRMKHTSLVSRARKCAATDVHCTSAAATLKRRKQHVVGSSKHVVGEPHVGEQQRVGGEQRVGSAASSASSASTSASVAGRQAAAAASSDGKRGEERRARERARGRNRIGAATRVLGVGTGQNERFWGAVTPRVV